MVDRVRRNRRRNLSDMVCSLSKEHLKMTHDQNEVEVLSSKLHDIYMIEAHRQGRVLHAEKYEDLAENIKEYDRVLARFIIDREAAYKSAVEKAVDFVESIDVQSDNLESGQVTITADGEIFSNLLDTLESLSRLSRDGGEK